MTPENRAKYGRSRGLAAAVSRMRAVAAHPVYGEVESRPLVQFRLRPHPSAVLAHNPHHLAARGDFEPFGHRFLRFNAFGRLIVQMSVTKEREL